MTLRLPAAPSPDVVLEPGSADGPLLVVLGGMPEQPGTLPPVEGRGLVRRSGAEGLLLRDRAESWFLRGVPGLADDLAGLATALRALAGERPLVLFGNSAGGYAALALGALAQAESVVAVVPRSSLTDAVNDALADDRLVSQRRRVLDTAEEAAVPFLDLPGLLATAFADRAAREGRPAYRTRYRVLHATDNRCDAAHAARLSGLPELAVTGYPRGDHQLASVLRRSGELDDVVATALRSAQREHRVAA